MSTVAAKPRLRWFKAGTITYRADHPKLHQVTLVGRATVVNRTCWWIRFNFGVSSDTDDERFVRDGGNPEAAQAEAERILDRQVDEWEAKLR